MAHDLLSPSAAARWLECPGSPALCADLPPEAPSPYADEGTRAHADAALAVTAVFEGKPITYASGDPDMEMNARRWAEMLWAEFRPGWDVRWFFAERPLRLDGVTGRENAFGTADFIALSADGTLLVADYKYGMGVRVSAERNPQLSIYALAAMDEFSDYDIKRVKLIIFQPRLEDGYSEYWWPLDELQDFRKKVQSAADLASSLMGSPRAAEFLNPGEAQCRFCRAKATCPALRAKVKAEIAADFDVIESPEKALPVPATGDQIAKALAWLSPIEEWCSAVRAAAQSRLEAGEPVPGYKLVAGRKGARKWDDGAEAKIASLRISKRILYKRTLASPAQLEKAHKQGLIGPRQWEKIAGLVTQSDGKPAVAPVSDRRPAINPSSVADEFSVIEE